MNFMDMLLGAKLLGGGSGGEEEQWVSATGTFTASAQSETIEHGLGVVPDYGHIFMNGASTSITDLCFFAASGKSKKQLEIEGADKFSTIQYGYVMQYNFVNKGSLVNTIAGYALDANSSLPMRNATDKEITFGGQYGLCPLVVGKEYTWYLAGRAK